jgi:hypothetical protein
VARVCGICAAANRQTVEAFMRRGLPWSKFHAKFPKFTHSQWGRHKHHIAARAEAVIEADERRGKGASLEEKDFREINRKLRVLAVAANRSGRVPHAINAYAAISRNLEVMQRLGAKGSDLPAPVITVVFRSPEEVEASRLRARDEIRAVDPGNAVLRDPEPRTALDEILPGWVGPGKDELPN